MNIKKYFFLCVLYAFVGVAVNAEQGFQSVELLQSLVEINSHSGNLSGIRTVREKLIPEFKKLGFMEHSFELEAGHRVMSFDFTGVMPKLALVGHMDTVFPPSDMPQKMRVEGTRLYGPGIIDMKGGLVVILNILNQLSIEERRQIRVLINDDEELASVYSRGKLKELAKGIPFGLVFEPGLPGGEVVTSSSGGRWIKVSVKGKAAHAGLEHKKGLNACVELATKIQAFNRLTDYSNNLTVNVGVIQGGTQPNVVCEEASATLDIRYVDPADLERVLAQVETISKKMELHNSVLNLTPSSNLETLAVVPSLPGKFTQKLFSVLRKVGNRTQKSIEGVHVGYATDANHLSETGMQLLVGMGPFGGGMHTDQEFMELDSLNSRSVLGTELVREILELRQ